MLKEALDRFIQKRVDAVINSNQADLPPIHYDPES
jgi:hypothetical protein